MAVHMYTQIYFFFFNKVENINFCNLGGKSPLENELQLYPSAVHLFNKDLSSESHGSLKKPLLVAPCGAEILLNSLSSALRVIFLTVQLIEQVRVFCLFG